jgi:predicted ATPase
MLTEIKLTNFKCFKEETSIPLGRFNLFTGVNGAGKSTALQALLLMRQSIEHNPYTTELILNGSCVNLGSFNDVKNQYVPQDDEIIFSISQSKKEELYSLEYHLKYTERKTGLFISKIHINIHPDINKESGVYHSELQTPEPNDVTYVTSEDENKRFNLLDLNPIYKILISGFELSLKKIHFISADRIGPQEFHQKTILPEFPNVGRNGEFAVSLLNMKAQELVNKDLCLGEDAKTLITQTEAWLGKILNPLSLDAKSLGKTNFLELLIGGFKPSNVGFGYSSILPIIVTGLIAKPNEKIIVENPEIHLHPKAQSALIEFLIKVAKTDVQIFIESHSDHILNALRIATKEKLLNPEDSSILFFNQNPETKSNEITSILIDEKGKLHRKTKEGTVAKIPKGFFDEWTNSMAKLF